MAQISAMIPFWIFTLGRVLYSGYIVIPFVEVIKAALVIVVPTLVGMIVVYFKPIVAKKMKVWCKVITLVVLLVGYPFSFYANFFMFYLVTWRVLLGGCLLHYTGYFLGYLAAFLLRLSHRDCRTIAIETGIQNAGTVLCIF